LAFTGLQHFAEASCLYSFEESAFAPFSYDQNLGAVAATGLALDGSLRVFWNASLGGALESAAMVNCIPEPTTFALAALGLCSVVASRRRRLA